MAQSTKKHEDAMRPHATRDGIPAALGLRRRLAAWAFACRAWIVFGGLLLTAGTVIAILQRRGPGRRIAHAAAGLIFRACGVPMHAQGLDSIRAQPHILVLNHTSFIDGLALYAMLPPAPGYAFVVRQQYRSQALLWPILRALGTLVLHARGEHGGWSGIESMRERLRAGDRLIVFPEGRIRPAPGLDDFHSGAFVAAAQAAAPVVAAGLHGARDVLALGTWMPRRAAVTLSIGPVFQPSGSGDELHRLVLASHDAVLALSGDLPASAS